MCKVSSAEKIYLDCEKDLQSFSSALISLRSNLRPKQSTSSECSNGFFDYWIKKNKLTLPVQTLSRGFVLEESEITNFATEIQLKADCSELAEQLSVFQTILLSEVKKIASLLSNSQIEFTLLKGASLSCFSYPSRSLRQYSDIDLLVESKQVEKTIASLIEIGFKPEKTLSQKKFNYELKTQHAISLVSTLTGIELDLHWRLAQRQYGFSDFSVALWNSRTKKHLDGVVVVSIPGDEEHALFLSMHASKNYWQDPRFLFDLMALSQNPNFSWPKLFHLARDYNQQKVLRISLLLAEKLVGLRYPAEIVNPNLIDTAILEDDPTRAKDFELVDKFYFQYGNQQPISELGCLKLDLQLKDNNWMRLKYLYYRIFTPHEEDWQAEIPDNLFFLHFIRKPFKLFLRALKSLIS